MRWLTHNFLEDDCILDSVWPLSYHSLNVFNKYVEVEARELPDILRPLFSLDVSLGMVKLEKVKVGRQVSDTCMRQKAEDFKV